MKAIIVLPLLMLAGCAAAPTTRSPVVSTAGPVATPVSPTATHAPASTANITLVPASGSLVSGRLQAMAMGDGLHLTGEIGGFAPGSAHGIHVHEKGDCSAADAGSAGGHFNPGGRPHGGPAGAAHHAGDMPNITADANGVARVDLHVAGIALGGAPARDVLGRAVVVHAQADDYASQPAGNSGARLACGVITAAR